MHLETLIRYANQDGDRQVALFELPLTDRPFGLHDVPAAGFGEPGTYFMLDAFTTREEAQEAADAHADLCVREGTYEAWHACVAKTEALAATEMRS